MTHEQFVIWLHGYLEITGTRSIEGKELQVIKDHLALFFDKVTPSREIDLSELIKEDFMPTVFPSPSQCTCNTFKGICPVHGGDLNLPNQIIC